MLTTLLLNFTSSHINRTTQFTALGFQTTALRQEQERSNYLNFYYAYKTRLLTVSEKRQSICKWSAEGNISGEE
jgi:hypothetical protein